MQKVVFGQLFFLDPVIDPNWSLGVLKNSVWSVLGFRWISAPC